tara:strand:+ start:1219 stop:2946 length:1728 start_codon:yes stop_codon:yes gene_type:complete
MTEISKIIDKALEENTFGKDFEFRKNQREVVEAICAAYLEDQSATLVIDAPTGSGKSLIAMWSSHVLKELGNKGYLITSDLALQDQYESDFYKYGLKWPSIKGVDNYECTVNGLPFSLGDCKLKGMGYEQAEKLHCYQSCDYLQNRKRAINLPVALLNYSFWLIQRNYVESKMVESNRKVPFEKRDFVFFDEAHRVDDIVQSHFSPRIDDGLVDKCVYINRFVNRVNVSVETQTKGSLQRIVNDLMSNEDPAHLLNIMVDFKHAMGTYRSMQNRLKSVAKSRFGSSSIPSDWQSAFTTLDRIKDIYCKFDDYIDIIEENGLESMVIDHREGESRFMCVKERQMIKKYLHEQSGFKVFMSATIGDPRSFVDIMGIDNAKFIRMDNDFNYDKSPIVFVNRHRLSYKEREKNLPKVVEILDKVLEKHMDQRGIIHSGSYMFSKFIKENSKFSDRLIEYSDSKTKKEALKLFKEDSNKILLGPSILEGLDLKDETSRFQIFFKVPYPSLGDPLIKAKLNQSNVWYNWKTSNQIMQGIGRSVRSKDDWAVTYILDASFSQLLGKTDAFPPSFTKRIKTIT